MEMAEETQVRESRGSRRVVPGGRNRKPNTKVLAFLLLAVCCTTGAAGGVYLSRQRAASVSQQDLTHEANVVSGDIPGKTKEQRQRELDSIVGEGMLAMFMNVTLFGKIAEADRSINWMIENPPNQGKLIRVEITRDNIGEKIFGTGAICPGNYLESDPLLIPLPVGEYDCTAVLLAYQKEAEILTEQAAVKIKLILQERKEGNAYEQK